MDSPLKENQQKRQRLSVQHSDDDSPEPDSDSLASLDSDYKSAMAGRRLSKKSDSFDRSPSKDPSNDRSYHMFDSDDDEDFLRLAENLVCTHSKHTNSSAKTFDCGCPPEAFKLVNNYKRYSVIQFIQTKTEAKTLISEYYIRDEQSYRSLKLILKDSWARTPVLPPGTILNVSGTCPDENDQLVVERDQGFLIVDPDKLVSVTSVVSMCWCERKVAFSERFRFPVDNLDTLRGSVAHDLICQCMNKKLCTAESIEKELATILRHPDVIEKAYGLGLSQQDLNKLGKELVLWILSFIVQRMMKKQPGQKWKIDSVRDIEDCYWNPEFGLKGKIDCTVTATSSEGLPFVIPLEFKTGNPQMIGRSSAKSDHLGQVYLYTLLMKSASDMPDNNGLLYYIREDHLVECSASMRDLQPLVMARNQIILNTLMKRGTNGDFRSIPRPVGVDFEKTCSRCEYQNICALSLKGHFKENNVVPSSFSKTERQLLSSIDYLHEDEIKFFDKWIQVINLEADEDENSYDAKDLWLKSVAQREKDGKCIGGLKLLHQSQEDSACEAMVTFEIPESKQHLSVIVIEKDFVVLGSQTDPCISFAYVEEVTKKSITLSLERLITGRHNKPENKFIVDKIKSGSAGTMQFVYLSKFMGDNPSSKRLRRKLIFGEKPEFKRMSTRDITKEQQEILVKYNKPQRIAIIKAMTTDSLLLIKGSPGCGKTTTIVGLVRMLVSQKKRVLVSAYTSNALDNILLSYKKHDNNFLRIGSGGKLNEELLRENSTNALRAKVSNVDEFADALNSMTLVGTTLLSLKHPIFKICKFDYCIVDEGSQALPTVIMGALMQADKCIIFGDPNQLPSVIKSRKIKSMNIEDNIFGMVSTPECYSNLTIQYRMNQFIMKIANELLYDNQMQCATEKQAQVSLSISGDVVKKYLLENINAKFARRWLCIAASKIPERSVMFFDTECIGAFESSVANTLKNIREKDVVLAAAKMFFNCGISAADIGIIAPYRGQVLLIRERLQSMNLDIEVNTVDQYQGREKNVIIVSFTKSIPFAEDGEKIIEQSILNDIRRLNVAITRAKAKVVLIGNRNTLQCYPACKKLFSLLSESQVYNFSSIDFYSNFFET